MAAHDKDLVTKAIKCHMHKRQSPIANKNKNKNNDTSEGFLGMRMRGQFERDTQDLKNIGA